MNENKIEKEKILNGKIVGLYQTKWSEPEVFCEGLGEAYYCEIIIELDSGLRIYLTPEDFHEWKNEEPIFRIKDSEHCVQINKPYEGQKIVSVCIEEDLGIFIILENGVFISTRDGYGFGFMIEELESYLKEYENDPINLRFFESEKIVFKDYWTNEIFDAKEFLKNI